mmetsp:Transcript_26019/g.35866  ORF Transcript_26019/g.35866 Transcript_26019/m.35866 type:complete len:104 (+) Transcript_26019:389-700(+)
MVFLWKLIVIWSQRPEIPPSQQIVMQVKLHLIFPSNFQSVMTHLLINHLGRESSTFSLVEKKIVNPTLLHLITFKDPIHVDKDLKEFAFQPEHGYRYQHIPFM